MTTRVLIVDDEANLRRMLEAVLADEGFVVSTAGTPDDARTVAAEVAPDVVFLDLVLGDGASGLEVLPALTDAHPGIQVIMMSGRATLADAVRATRLGAFQFLEKPLTPEAVLTTARAAADLADARSELRALRARLEDDHPLIGTSTAMDDLREVIARVAPTPSRILIMGESGTGKELVARAVHARSTRAAGPWVAVNCAAVPRELLESELFGHEKGAFTGASQARDGKFQLAHKGTLFLDEVGDLEPAAQAKLLRVLETGTVERVGGDRPRNVDVRVIAATNRDLEGDVASGRFREDLFFRLNVVPVHVPALRDRLDDLPDLVPFLAARAGAQCTRQPRTFGAQALDRLARHAWPGNVRELGNLIERLTILGDGAVTVKELEQALGAGRSARGGGGTAERRGPSAEGLAEELARHEKRLIEDALQRTESIAEAARLLHTDRGNLYRRMKRLGVRPSDTGAS